MTDTTIDSNQPLDETAEPTDPNLLLDFTNLSVGDVHEFRVQGTRFNSKTVRFQVVTADEHVYVKLQRTAHGSVIGPMVRLIGSTDYAGNVTPGKLLRDQRIVITVRGVKDILPGLLA
jgi:hypothetical protein